jgi:hypothetical protein
MTFSDRTLKKHGKAPPGQTHSTRVFAKEGPNACRPYIVKITEEEFKSHLNATLAGEVTAKYRDSFLNDNSELAKNLRDQGAVEKLADIFASSIEQDADDTLAERLNEETTDPLAAWRKKGRFNPEKPWTGLSGAQGIEALGIGNPEADPTVQVYQFLTQILGIIGSEADAKQKARWLKRKVSSFSWRKKRLIPSDRGREVLDMIAAAVKGETPASISTGDTGAELPTAVVSDKDYSKNMLKLYRGYKKGSIISFVPSTYKGAAARKEGIAASKESWLEFVKKQDIKKEWTLRPSSRSRKVQAEWLEVQKKRATAFMAYLDSGKVVTESNNTIGRWQKLAGILKG